MGHSDQITCNVGFWYFRRMALMFILLAGAGAWFYYDGLINWPNKNKIYLAKLAFDAGSGKREWSDFNKEIESYEIKISEVDALLIKKSFQDGKLPMQWEEYLISTEGKRAVSKVDKEKIKEAFFAGKQINLNWENFARQKKYPLNKNESLKTSGKVNDFESLYNAFEAANLNRKWSLYGVLSGNDGWSNADPKYHNPGEITAQIVIGSILSLFSLFVLMLTVINRGRFLSSDDESFTTEHGLQVAFNEIKKIDTRKWNKKGLAYVYYINDKGLSARAVIDDLKYKGADEILERIKSEFTGELIENAPNILQTED